MLFLRGGRVTFLPLLQPDSYESGHLVARARAPTGGAFANPWFPFDKAPGLFMATPCLPGMRYRAFAYKL